MNSDFHSQSDFGKFDENLDGIFFWYAIFLLLTRPSTQYTMTTPWISRPRWTCTYCNITINDDIPSRTQHENGLRHKGNVERSLREAYKKSERERTEEREQKRTMKEIERMAKERHEQDVDETELMKAGSSKDRRSTFETAGDQEKEKQKTPAKWKPTDRFATYGSAMPIYPDEQSRLNEMHRQQIILEESQRKKEGTAGEWQTVELRTPPSDGKVQASDNQPRREKQSPSSYQVHEKKGTFFNINNEEDDVSLKTIKVKKRVRTGDEEQQQRKREVEQKAMVPEWKPVRLDTGISAKKEGIQTVPIQRINDEIKAVPVDLSEEHAHEQESKVEIEKSSEPSSSSSSGMFKKRKTGSGSGAKKVRALV